MSHPNNQLVGGFFPFPEAHIATVASYFHPCTYRNALALDSMAGTGDPLIPLAAALNLKPYLNELDRERAQVCQQRTSILQATEGDMFNLRTPHEAFVLNWCNPPYTHNHGGADEKRREFEMLREAWKWTQDGAYTVWVVYDHHMTERAAKYLCEHSRTVDVYRIPGKHLDTYTQIVVIARKRPKPQDADPDLERRVLALVQSCKESDKLPLLEQQQEPKYRFPAPANLRRFYFRQEVIEKHEILAAIQAYGAQHNNAFRALTAPPPPHVDVECAVPPRSGQIGLMVASGLFNGLVLDLESGPAAVRGVARMAKIDISEPTDRGTREVRQFKAQVTITLLHQNGQITTIPESDTKRLVEFLRTHQSAFVKYITAHSKAVYNFDYSDLKPVFNRVFRNRKLAGRPVTGLFETQAHVVGAAYAVLKHRRAHKRRPTVLINGDMGVGKSVIAATLIGVMHYKQDIKPGEMAVVMAPPHLVDKWVAEMRDAVPGTYIRVVETVADVRRFVDHLDRRPMQLHTMVISRERAKLAEGWDASYYTRRVGTVHWKIGEEPPMRFRDPQTKELLPDAKRVSIDAIMVCPRCGEAIREGKGERAPYASLSWLQHAKRTCSACRAPLWQNARTFSAPKPGQGQPTKNPRYPLADLLAQRYRDRLAVVVCDEIHELKSEAADQGKAMQRLIAASRYGVGLTGTLFGGMASTLFWIEWAFNERMYDAYPISPEFGGRKGAVDAWVRQMGVLEQTIEYKNNDDPKAKRYSGNTPIEGRPVEAPGMSPHLLRQLVDHVIWVNLPDLAFALPDYEEIPVGVHLPAEVQRHYHHEVDKMKDYLVERRFEGDASFMSTYLQSALRYPSSCFRPKQAVHKGMGPIDQETGSRTDYVVAHFKGWGEDNIYPKEQTLIDLLNTELETGRPCAVFVDQTGTLDIMPRLERLIREQVPLARPVIMRTNSTSDTRQREAWLKKRVSEGINILICHPKLVATGLDLLHFKSLIVYEPIYSLYVLSQVSRRHWRIGQTAPCKVYYMFYQQTMEAQAIQIISEKQQAAALLIGDAEGGGLAQLAAGPRSLEAELAKAVADSNMVVDVSELFKQKAHASADFTSGWAAHGHAVDEDAVHVIPLDNLIGQHYYADHELHEVVDYGPLTEASYVARNLAKEENLLVDARTVQRHVNRYPASFDSPVELPRRIAASAAMPSTTVPGFSQYETAKRQNPKGMIFVQIGQQIHTYDDDARILQREAQIKYVTAGENHLRATVDANAFNAVRKLLQSKRFQVGLIRLAAPPSPAVRASKPASVSRAPTTSKSALGAPAPPMAQAQPHTPLSDGMAALHQQHLSLKTRHPEAAPLFQSQGAKVGVFYTAFDEVAQTLASACNLTLKAMWNVGGKPVFRAEDLDDPTATALLQAVQFGPTLLERCTGVLKAKQKRVAIIRVPAPLDSLAAPSATKTHSQPAAPKPAPSRQLLGTASKLGPRPAAPQTELTPARPQPILAAHRAFKAKHPDILVLFPYSEASYRAIGLDAERLAKALGQVMSRQSVDGQTMNVLTVSSDTLNRAASKLKKQGIQIAKLHPGGPATTPRASEVSPGEARAFRHYRHILPLYDQRVLLIGGTNGASDTYYAFDQHAKTLAGILQRSTFTPTGGELVGVPIFRISKAELARDIAALKPALDALRLGLAIGTVRGEEAPPQTTQAAARRKLVSPPATPAAHSGKAPATAPPVKANGKRKNTSKAKQKAPATKKSLQLPLFA